MASSRYFLSAVLAGVLVGAVLGYFFWPHGETKSQRLVKQATPEANLAEATNAPQIPGMATNVRGNSPMPDPYAIPGEKVLRFKSAGDLQRFLEEARKRGLRVLAVIPKLNAVRVGASSDAILSQLLQGVDAAQVGDNYVVSVPSDPSNLTPNAKTPLAAFDQNWIKAMGVDAVDPAWGQGIKIAVLDTGIDPNFALAKASIQNIDLTTSTSTAANGAATDSMSHGTAVASLIAGEDPQFEGMAPASSLVNIKALNANGEGDIFTVAEAIVNAVDTGSKVINLSLGSYGDSSVLRDAVTYAQVNNVAIVAASGNDGVGQLVYPAAYPGVLAVGADDASLQPAYFSNYGDGLGVIAPGVGLPAAQANDQAVSFSGTSASTATVSGTLAALLSSDPSLTPIQAENLIKTYADDWGTPGWDAQSGYGTVNLGRVLARNTPGIVDGAVASQIILSQNGPNQPLTMGVTVQNQGTAIIGSGQLTVQVGGSQYFFSVPNLAPTKSVMETVQVYPYQLVNGQVVITSQFNVAGASDTNLSNNAKQSSLKVVTSAKH